MNSDESVRNAQVIFSIRQNTSTTSEDNCSTILNQDDAIGYQNESDSDGVMCVLYKNNHIGAAFFKKTDRQLYIVNDVTDQAPYFFLCRLLYENVNPIHTITLGALDEPFIKFMVHLQGTKERGEDDVTVTTSDAPPNIPPNLSIISSKEYTFEACKSAVQSVTLASYPTGATAVENDIYLHSLINFEATQAVHALGALIIFLNRNWIQFEDTEEIHFLHINQISLDNHVLMDRNTYSALQIFNSRSHDATSKKGISGTYREGLSIYKLFSTHCKSSLGQKHLKQLLMNPVNDLEILNERLNLIGFSVQMNNKTFADAIHDTLKNIENIDTVLENIHHRRATVRHWDTLYKTMVRIVSVAELCFPHRQQVLIFHKLCSVVTPQLHGLIDAIHSAIDFSSHRRTRPVIKFGLDEKLDAKKLQRRDVRKNLNAAADFALKQLPNYFTECYIVFVPEMGHLIVVNKQEQEMESSKIYELGFQHMFTIKGEAYYKNPMCVELDAQLGEINLEIIAHENRILERLSGYMLTYNAHIHEPLRFIALIDCLLAMSKVALLNGYVRPTINEQNIHEIKDGRHPLMEFISSDYQSNDFYSTKNNGKVKILTGPNGSGKSIYLKQVTLIIFLTHVGSFVPAVKANIAKVHSIHSPIHAAESICVRLSSFMIDLSQISTALNIAKASSFITIDEFGRGTTGSEGVAILAGALRKFLDKDEYCPHILVSSHLHQVLHYLPSTPNVRVLRMQHTICEEKLVFSFKVTDGVSSSYALDMAKAMGLEDDIVNRVKAILLALQKNEPLTPLNQKCEMNTTNINILEIPESNNS